MQAKQGADLHASTFAQMIAFEVARGGFLDRHMRCMRTASRERRDAMFAALPWLGLLRRRHGTQYLPHEFLER